MIQSWFPLAAEKFFRLKSRQVTLLSYEEVYTSLSFGGFSLFDGEPLTQPIGPLLGHAFAKTIPTVKLIDNHI